MEIIGRLTADAKTNQLPGGRKVVNFSIAINETYRVKGSDVVTKTTTFVNCSYWINPGIETLLKKGSLVELFGRISVNAWVNADGEPKGSLNFHVNNIKLHGRIQRDAEPVQESNTKQEEVKDDLPF